MTLLFAAVLLIAACGAGSSASTVAPPISSGEAEDQLKAIVLTAGDVGEGFTQDVERVQTNDNAAAARPDTDNARRQYADWGQVLSYNVQYGATSETGLVYTGSVARIMNTATLYQTPEGAGSALAFERSLSPSVIANILVNDGPGTRISETQVVKDITFPARGDESFAWRLSGKATFENGLVTTFVADAVFVRKGRVTGAVIAVALGEQPDRAKLSALVDRFIEHATDAQQ
ncbi:MAG: hypothetical protein M3P30_00465 [Chloroflexota bacterium]|nr:hypothetical protein [Chloroflexota bacterium]